MSQRTNSGMMAVVGKPNNPAMDELERKLLASSDPAAPNEASSAPVMPEEPKAEGRGREVVRRATLPDSVPVDSLMEELTPPAPQQLEVLHTRIPVWLNEAIKDKLAPLERANSRFTKQALITYCLIKALGVTPPDDFRLY